MVPCVGNKPPISVKVERKKNSIMISLVLAEVPERESRKHLRYVEEKSLKTEDHPTRYTLGFPALTPDLGLLSNSGQHESQSCILGTLMLSVIWDGDTGYTVRHRELLRTLPGHLQGALLS